MRDLSPRPDAVAAHLEQANTLVSKARTLVDAEKAMRVADAAQRYCRRANLSQELMDAAHGIRVRSMTLMGRYLLATPRNRGAEGNPGGRGAPVVRSPEGTTHHPTLRDLGLTKKMSANCQFMAKVADDYPDLHDDLLNGSKSIKDAHWEVRVRHNKAEHDANVRKVEVVSSFPTGEYSTIVSDFPWTVDGKSEGFESTRFPPNYALMSDEKLFALPVGSLAARNAHVYMWVTKHSLWRGRDLLEHYGFRYVDILTWCKPEIGLGNHFRGQTEFVLFGIKGSLPLLRRNVGTWFQAPRGPGGAFRQANPFLRDC